MMSSVHVVGVTEKSVSTRVLHVFHTHFAHVRLLVATELHCTCIYILCKGVYTCLFQNFPKRLLCGCGSISSLLYAAT